MNDKDIVSAIRKQEIQVEVLMQAGQLDKAKELLDILYPLWKAVGYAHIGTERYRSLRLEAERLEDISQQVKISFRKNSTAWKCSYKEEVKMHRIKQECTVALLNP